MKIRMNPREWRNLRTGLLFASPWVVGFLGFTLYPIISSFIYSLNVFTILGQSMRWVGLANYKELLFGDKLLWKSLYNTLFMVALGTPFHILIAIIIALLLNLKLRGVAFYRTVYYLPTIVPVIATSVLWLWIFNPEYGLINSFLSVLGIHGPGWLTEPELVKPAFILMGVWTIGGTIVIFLAGMQDVPVNLLEAATLDGAGGLQRVLYVTLPLLSPVILFNLVMGVIGGFQIFTQAFVMTNGGPLDATLFYALYLYQNAFVFFKMPYASAMAWLLFLVVLLATFVIFRSSARFVYYEGEDKR
jgi:multiple sugar transport system permease protein